MQLETLSCNNCGGPLEVPESANYVACNHCGARLVVKRTASTTYTEQLEKIESKQEEMLEKLQRLERANRIASIDRAWERQKQGFMVKDKYGNLHEPSELGVIAMLAVAVFGVGFIVVAGLESLPFAGFGLLIVGLGLGGAYYMHLRTKEFRAARRRYRRRRLDASLGKSSNPVKLDQVQTPAEFLESLEKNAGG